MIQAIILEKHAIKYRKMLRKMKIDFEEYIGPIKVFTPLKILPNHIDGLILNSCCSNKYDQFRFKFIACNTIWPNHEDFEIVHYFKERGKTKWIHG